MHVINPKKVFFIALGWVFVLLGIIGAFLPVIPTTVFMILALWSFAESSPRFHDWLYHHRVFGPPLQKWKKYRVIPPVAKIMSVFMMSASFIYVVFFMQWPVYAIVLLAVFFTFAAGYILSKPSHIPVENTVVDK